MREHRVVVTGLGMVSPVGLSASATWEAVLKGTNGIGPITLFDPTGHETTFAAEVKDFDPGHYMDRKEVRRNDRFVQFAMASSMEAVEHARLSINGHNAEDVGVIMGSGIGGITTLSEQMQVLKEKGPRRVSPFLVPMMIVDMASGAVSIALGAKGPNFCTVSACATGADAIGVSYELIRRGDIKAMVAGGTEAAITPIGVAGFASARALSSRNDDPAHASRPFDKNRDGFVMGEGAATLVLESLESAKERGATILAEVAGYAATADAHHITQPAPGGEGGVRAMSLALKRGGLQPEDVDYINAHGTSTPMNDEYETQAIKTVFGEHAYKVPISSTKSMIGHLLGAAGAIEAAFCVQAIGERAIPPTINYETPDPVCDLDYTPNSAREVDVRVALTNSLGFGGHNATLVFKRFEE
jgi:3-oxoacyl-[acyl-carrier-protein] synthase II